jgi:hypothetical protein
MIARRGWTTAFVGFLLLVALGAKKPAPADIDLSRFDFRSGDIVFQHLPSRLGSVICDVTDSQFSHCGIVVVREGSRPYVLEAIGPVRFINLQDWLKQGDRGRFQQMRLRDVTEPEIKASLLEAAKLLGRPYDIQYELDEDKIYCSELVYKAFLGGAKIEVGEKQPLRDLNWRPHELFIRALAGGELPLDREMVTPDSVARSPKLKLVYSTFPAREDEPLHDSTVLAGRWMGEYTGQSLKLAQRDAPPILVKRQPGPFAGRAAATLEFDDAGDFVKGEIRLDPQSSVPIREFSVTPFDDAREFQAKLRDGRGVEGAARAQIRDSGRRIIGTWTDHLGNRGVFSFEKEDAEDN